MPSEWSALSLGRQPAPGPRVPVDADLDLDDFLERVRRLMAGQPSLVSRMQDLSRLQRERLATGQAGPPLPDSPEYRLGLEVAGSVKGQPSVLSLGPIAGLLSRALDDRR